MAQWRIDEPQSLDLTGVRRLDVRVVAGSVDVVGRPAAANPDGGADDGAAHLEVSRVDGPLIVTLEGDTLTIAHERLSWSGLLDRLVDSGKSVVVIEHHQAVMAHADWIIDLGPGAGHDGGRIVFEGMPAKLVAARKKTLTGEHLAAYVGA